MAIAWHYLRVPVELHGELVALAEHFDRMQTLGKMNVPSRFADPRGGHVGTPLWFVIRRALDEWREKKRRSRRKRPNGRPGRRRAARKRFLGPPCKHQTARQPAGRIEAPRP